MHTYGIRGASLLGAACVLALTGCAQMGGLGVSPGNDARAAVIDQPSHECNPALGGAIGALAGSMFGKGKGHLAGAAIGAGIGAFACMAYNYHARKVRDARAVEAQYERERGTLPASNTIGAYQSELIPGQTVKSGSKAAMQSRVTLIRGTNEGKPQLKEQLTLFSPEGKQLTTVTKDASAIDGTGEYETNFDFNLPKGIQEGRYTMRSALYMDGRQVRTNEVPMLVVS
ncbi:glycine zipper domain-containing protein [Frateuria sp. STR12]|uniref:glycine zipper domain-containing protein n=1 Tax=Frateuria hangzhouensis TaxID=2995589 RepID=UPI002260B8AC|nr:glycine zipper domain-containing protein [Frateuria sp. STR12]MCX7514345.1 glycine zipper domain-containing protein [Frateuria sp. STR12]